MLRNFIQQSTMIEFLILIVCILVIYKQYKNLQYWKEYGKYGVPYTKGYPIFGSLWKSMLNIRAIGHVFQDSYNKFSNHRYFGFFLFNKPTLVIRDAELVKQICIKDFDSFRDHRLFLPVEADPFWNKVVFSRKGNDWRTVRRILLPLFSQSKTKIMFTFMSSCAQRLINNFSKTEVTEVQMSDLLNKFTNDIFIKCMFNIDCDSYKNPDNDFYRHGQRDFVNNTTKSLKFFAVSLSPMLSVIFRVTFFSEQIKSFLRSIINETFEYRQKNQKPSFDMLYLLKEAQKGQLAFAKGDELESKEFTVPKEDSRQYNNEAKPNELTDDDILAQVIGFIFTNYDTVATFISNVVYELAMNPDIQDKLIDEIDEVWSNCDGQLTYDLLTSMKYMDMVASEGIRLRGPTIILDRIVTKPYTIHPVLPHEKPLHLTPGTDITIPAYCLMHDPQYFPDPEKFDPERFNNENKHSVLRHTILTFGIGPRSCLAPRLSLLELKVVLFYFLLKFKFVPTEKTSIPFTLNKLHISQCHEKKYWLGLQPRN